MPNCGTSYGGKPNKGKTRKGKICPKCKGSKIEMHRVGWQLFESPCSICGGTGRVAK